MTYAALQTIGHSGIVVEFGVLRSSKSVFPRLIELPVLVRSTKFTILLTNVTFTHSNLCCAVRYDFRRRM